MPGTVGSDGTLLAAAPAAAALYAGMAGRAGVDVAGGGALGGLLSG
jgi:hypothetical protein